MTCRQPFIKAAKGTASKCIKLQQLQIIAKIILHSIYVLNYAKVYVKHNIFHKKIPIHDFPCSLVSIPKGYIFIQQN